MLTQSHLLHIYLLKVANTTTFQIFALALKIFKRLLQYNQKNEQNYVR